MKIYTKNGDAGNTGLIGGTIVHKNDIRIEAYGTIDELNSQIGLLMSYNLNTDIQVFLESVQHNLFVIGSYLATDTSKIEHKAASVLSESSIKNMEDEIDKAQSQLPEIREFILPGGSTEASIAHICRTVTRRAERRIIEMTSVYSVDNQIIMYINRLSDYFFVLSRLINVQKGVKEILWKK